MPDVPVLPGLPEWGDPGSIAAFIVVVVGLVTSTLAVFGVAVPAGIVREVTAGSGYAGAVIAFLFTLWSHRSAHAKLAVALAYAQGAHFTYSPVAGANTGSVTYTTGPPQAPPGTSVLVDGPVVPPVIATVYPPA